MVLHDELAEALEKQTDFTQEDWRSFHIYELYGDNYVRGPSGRFFQPDDNRIFRLLAEQCSNAAFFVIFLVYPSTSQAIFAHFICETFDTNSEVPVTYMRNDMSIDCTSAAYQAMTIYAVVMVLIYPIGTPVSRICKSFSIADCPCCR